MNRKYLKVNKTNTIKSLAALVFRLVFRRLSYAFRSLVVAYGYAMRKSANASPHKSEPPSPSPPPPPHTPQAPRKKLSFREPEVMPRGGNPRVVLDRADEFELDEELQVIV